MKQFIILCISLLFSVSIYSQSDSAFIRKVYDEALLRGKAYEDLRQLCKDIGARLSGSAEAQMAVEWSEKKMKEYGFDKVYLQEIKVPHWERGTKESAWIRTKSGKLIKLHLLALGGSIGTDGLMQGEVVEFKTIDDLKKATENQVKGKIVFLNQEMDAAQIQTFKAYGACYAIRGNGAVEAGKLGAKAVVIRSLGLPLDDHPHTGSMHYEANVARIPAGALATKDAQLLSEELKNGKAELVLEMDCRVFPDATSYNVIGEMTGSKFANEIITFGGHLDSWDTGEGAHDDGAGVIHCLEALRILKTMNYKPIHTLRVVFFMNEENGNMGGKSYAAWVKEKGEKHIAAIESDRGGFAPRGFTCDGNDKQVAFLKSFAPLFKEYDLHIFEKGYGGVDIGPLKDSFPGIPCFGFVPDSQRYFDFHHAPSDVFESVNKRELELGAAGIASFLYLLDRGI
ncbi:MAG: M20/M25/M40 family metallo-hydrolase [Flavobacteriales bacterium]|nr:M20/M25/M40 family metallo-hydrolase [Flavobacteriales bacterium]